MYRKDLAALMLIMCTQYSELLTLATCNCAPPAVQLFMERWEAREPIVVRGVKGEMQWEPDVMQRACREMGITDKSTGFVLKDKELQVSWGPASWVTGRVGWGGAGLGGLLRRGA